MDAIWDNGRSEIWNKTIRCSGEIKTNSAFIDLQKGKLMLGGGAAANVCALVGALNKRGVAAVKTCGATAAVGCI